MKDHRTLNRWLRKVFNRLEWPQLVARFKVAGDATPGDISQPLILSHAWIPPPAGSEHIQVSAVTDALAQHLAGRLDPSPTSLPLTLLLLSTDGALAEMMVSDLLDGQRRKQ